MLSDAALATPGADSSNTGTESLFIGAIGARSELDKGMQRNCHPGAFLLALLLEVGVDATEDGLMSDDEDVLASLELHDDRLETDHNIAVRLTTTVAVVVFVLVTCNEVGGILLFDFGISKSIAHTGIKFIECLPLELVVSFGEVLGSCNGTLKGRGPDGKRTIILRKSADE